MEICDFVKWTQAKLLEILDFVHDICTKENIPYSLAYGTMLGAVRHRGFIPWDGDIDLVMQRADYERFFEVLPKYPSDTIVLKEGKFWIRKFIHKQPPTYNGKPLKTQLQVDIFVLDRLPKTPKEKKRLFFKLRKYQGMLTTAKISDKKFSLKYKILLLGTRIMGLFHKKSTLCRRYDKISKQYTLTGGDLLYVSNESFKGIEKAYHPDWFLETADHPFENRTYKMYTRFEEILTEQYGDYMQLPPESERIFPHQIP